MSTPWAIGVGFLSALTLGFLFVRIKRFKVIDRDFYAIRPKKLPNEQADVYNAAYNSSIAKSKEARATGAPKLKLMMDKLIVDYQVIEYIEKGVFNIIQFAPAATLTTKKKQEEQKKLKAIKNFFMVLKMSDLKNSDLIQRGLLLVTILRNLLYLLLNPLNRERMNEFYEAAEDIEPEEFAEVLEERIEELKNLLVRTKRLIDLANEDHAEEYTDEEDQDQKQKIRNAQQLRAQNRPENRPENRPPFDDINSTRATLGQDAQGLESIQEPTRASPNRAFEAFQPYEPPALGEPFAIGAPPIANENIAIEDEDQNALALRRQ